MEGAHRKRGEKRKENDIKSGREKGFDQVIMKEESGPQQGAYSK